ncbi:MAG: MobC family plasmid mobilization relaxosome protein [Cytophagales bacterium]|nr:MobC family plasmid mobilization relaxosome protein [Cytophagales bacterium]
MSRRKAKHREELLTHPIRTRIRKSVYQRLVKMMDSSDCQSIGELARKILSREKITCYYRDATMDAPMEELIFIRKELNTIGVNINQITHKFHIADNPGQMIDQAIRVEKEYKKVGEKVDHLLAIVFEISKKWLQK